MKDLRNKLMTVGTNDSLSPGPVEDRWKLLILLMFSKKTGVLATFRSLNFINKLFDHYVQYLVILDIK